VLADGAHRLGRAQGVLALGEDGAQIRQEEPPEEAAAQVQPEPQTVLDRQGGTMKLIRRITAAVLPAKGKHRR
jgi:hypothetical protein